MDEPPRAPAREQAERKAAESSHVKEREAVEDKEGAEKRRQRVKDWRVVLHNDDIHTFECVEDAITKVLPHISRARAYDIALHAHTNSKATIMLTWEEKATEVAMALQGEGLTVSVLPDKLFNKQEEQK
ncbi:ATP-dependent Clp protease adaptor domain-containing protein, putative [Eimeria praecox]|uniref:ATP-dependent Clp protease adaptor domain-containing protein, putative n=1 Tax=Eimeria praecox TaxID=51316 RepID=U6H3T3_9EIME|nr:ATP-dependent Clp protease adaptor domain-containing protein, putative [Eimeria praecox]